MTGAAGSLAATIDGRCCVRMDDAFRQIEAWTFPPAVLERLAPNSVSGASWTADGRLTVSGHDRPELYVVAVPRSGNVLERGDGSGGKSGPGNRLGSARPEAALVDRPQARGNRASSHPRFSRNSLRVSGWGRSCPLVQMRAIELSLALCGAFLCRRGRLAETRSAHREPITAH